MPKYMLISPHRAEDCLRALDEVVAHNPQLLDKIYLGCHHGDHTAYGIIDAASETEVRNMLPSILRDSASVTEVEQETPDKIRSYHQKAA